MSQQSEPTEFASGSRTLISPRSKAQRRIITALGSVATFLFLTSRGFSDPDLSPEVLILPGIFTTPETGFGAGAGLFVLDRPISGSRGSKANALRIGAIYTEKKQFIVRGSLEKYLNGERDLLSASVVAQEYPDSFFGIGSNTRVVDEEKYISHAWNAQAKYLHEYSSNLYFGAYALLSDERIDHLTPDGFLALRTDQNKNQINGIDPVRLGGAGITIRLDTRDDYQDPTKGYFVEGGTILYRKAFGSTHEFNTTTLDGRWFVPLTTADNPLRLGFQTVITSNNGSPPFQSLAQLGGRDVLRGYFLGRFRDRNLLAFQSELRIPLRGKWGAVGYAAVGNVSKSWDGMRAKEFKPAGGIGARYRFSDVQKVNLRLDFTWGHETPNPSYYLSLAEAF